MDYASVWGWRDRRLACHTTPMQTCMHQGTFVGRLTPSGSVCRWFSRRARAFSVGRVDSGTSAAMVLQMYCPSGWIRDIAIEDGQP
jgi:hypothetical protein